MRVYVIRHAEAVALGEQGVSFDEERPLTPQGLAQCRDLSQTLRRLGVKFDLLLSSPLLRALQTAEKLHQEGFELRTCLPLAPGGKKRHVVECMQEVGASSIGLVGHNPDLSELVGWFIGEKTVGIDLDKAGIACLYFEGKLARGAALLEWLVTPAWCAALATAD